MRIAVVEKRANAVVALAAFWLLGACSERTSGTAQAPQVGGDFRRQVAATEARRGVCIGDSIFAGSISRLQAVYRQVLSEKTRPADSALSRSMASSAGTSMILATDAALAAKLDLEETVALLEADDFGGALPARMSARDKAIIESLSFARYAALVRSASSHLDSALNHSGSPIDSARQEALRRTTLDEAAALGAIAPQARLRHASQFSRLYGDSAVTCRE